MFLPLWSIIIIVLAVVYLILKIGKLAHQNKFLRGVIDRLEGVKNGKDVPVDDSETGDAEGES